MTKITSGIMEGDRVCPKHTLIFFGGEGMLERDFQQGLIKAIKKRFSPCIILKNDPTYLQGVPDLIVLKRDRWAALECKKSSKANRRPNQEYYVAKMKDMSYAAFVYPENMEDVLDDLQRTFES